MFVFYFQTNTIKVLWSFGDKDPIHGDIKGHDGNRGVKSLYLMSPLFKKPLKNNIDIRQWDVTVKNVSITPYRLCDKRVVEWRSKIKRTFNEVSNFALKL